MGFAALPFAVNDTEAVVLAHCDDEGGEVLVGDAAAQLAVEGIDGGLAQGMAVDVVDGAAEGVGDRRWCP